MKLSIDTKEDSHEDLKKVIRMLQHIVGDSGEVFTNQPLPDANANPFSNIFGDSSSIAPSSSESSSVSDLPSAPADESSAPTSPSASESTDDLFAELFSEEEIKKMDVVKAPEDEDEEEELNSKEKTKSKKPDIEFY